MQQEDDKNVTSCIDNLPKANPIQLKVRVEPKSIAPLLPLPDFKFPHCEVDLAPCFSVKEQPQQILPSTQLRHLFAKPVYQASRRYNPQNNNLHFATLKAFYQESAWHPSISPSQDKIPNELVFESRFQSGNLAYAARAQEAEKQYYLLIQKDINTSRCTQWFFFRVENGSFRGKVRFHILNLSKSYSSFENGMKVSLCSSSSEYSWTRGCEDIRYHKNNIQIGQNRFYYTLSFTYDFQTLDSTTYFAHAPPYTFSMMDKHLLPITNNMALSGIFRRKTLTESPGGNYVDMLTITNFKVKRHKKVVFISSRVHPGETPASFVCQAITDFLLGSSDEARRLRDSFVFKIVPMLNPDGVINGCYRCSLSGYDLNRVWHTDNKRSSPEVYYTKRALLQLEDCFMFIDLHAHSKKKGVFMYGCQNRNSPYLSRHIPYLLWKESQYFNYYQCNFGMKLGRQGTARLSVHNGLNLLYSYTMEHSFCSPVKYNFHFSAQHYAGIGKSVCFMLCKYFCIRDQNQNQQVFQQLYSSKELLRVGGDEDGQSSQDSQLSEPTQFKEIEKVVIKRKPSQLVPLKPIQKIKSFNSTQKLVMNKTSTLRLRTNRNEQHPQNTFASFLSRNLPSDTLSKGHVVGVSDQVVIIKRQTPEIRGDIVYPSVKLEEEPSSAKYPSVRLRDMGRYHEMEEMDGLSNLFLPSLTSASYKRYGKKINNPKAYPNVGRKYLESQGIIKEEIKSVSRRKNRVRDKANSFL